MLIKITPTDTLFFKDGKPFSMGDDSWADGIFPPYPSVIYGALRSLYFSENIDKLEFANAPIHDPTKDFKINKIYYDISNSLYFPSPLDLVKKVIDEQIIKLNLEDNNFYSSYDLAKILTIDGNVENLENALISESDFSSFLLNNENTNIDLKFVKDYIIKEAKVGVAISNNTGTSEDGKLYRIGLNRILEDFSIIIDVDFGEGIEFNPYGKIIKLGAEGKTAFCDEYYSSLDLPEITFDEKIKLYALTPSIFKNGWYPETWNFDENYSFIYKYDDKVIKLKLESAIIGKPLMIGGFDMKAKIPKPMLRAVPTGSIYYLKLEKLEEPALNGKNQGDLNSFAKHIQSNSISEYDTFKQGLGIFLAGVY